MRSLRERIVHTALFEILAVAIAAPSISALTDAPLGTSGLLSILLSVGAVLSNYVWTLVFDRLVPTRRRGFWLRAGHALGLEAIIMTFSLPLLMVFTGLGFWQALLMDLAGIMFFVVFSMIYNSLFDAVMIRLGSAAA